MLYRDYGYLKIGRGLCLLQSRDFYGCKYVSSNLLHQKNVLKKSAGCIYIQRQGSKYLCHE